MMFVVDLRRQASTLFFSTSLGLLICCCAPAPAAEHVIYAFQGGKDGAYPSSQLVIENAKTFIGTTAGGGAYTGCSDGSHGCGTIFSLGPEGSESVLYAFQGGNDGGYRSGLVGDDSGNFYGVSGYGSYSWGTVFKFTPGGSKNILYNFTGGADGGEPEGDLTIDSNGNLYGATQFGGDMSCLNGQGCGTVFEVSFQTDETTLYAFQGGTDGAVPLAGVIRDKNGNLFGTTAEGGGSPNCTVYGSDGCGVVYEIAAGGTETVLYAFQGGNDGRVPRGVLVADSSGNLLGTTAAGGPDDDGTIFKLTPNGTETVLHAFKGGSDGEDPEAGLIMDKSGNLDGTTYFGGGTGCRKTGHIGCGTAFKLAPDGTEKVLASFSGKDGTYPAASLLLKSGILYGTASEGGTHHDGVVFKLKQ